MQVQFFKTALDFRTWLEAHFQTENELLVGYYKVGSGLPSLSWSDSVDQALCFGWIDSVRRTIDDKSYCIRFTPRKKNSIWSAVNIKKMNELTKAGLMTEAGLKAFSFRKEAKSNLYSFVNEISTLSEEFQRLFLEKSEAWNFFDAQAPSYKKAILHWIMSAKQEKTKLSRLEKTTEASAQKLKLDARK